MSCSVEHPPAWDYDKQRSYQISETRRHSANVRWALRRLERASR